jgi:hypothetical protein
VSVKISIIVEGATERIFFPVLREFLRSRLTEMPKLDPLPCNGRLPKSEELKRRVAALLSGSNAADAVIALTDVYTGTQDFKDAMHAKKLMQQWVGNEPRFFPHVALHDFEAWLLPYWSEIQNLAGSNRGPPSANPEAVNHDKPPADVLAEVFRGGSKGRRYVKPRDAGRILRGKDLSVAAAVCPELKSFLNRILELSGGAPL